MILIPVATLGAEANGFTQLASNFVSYATLITLAFNSMAARFISVSYHKGDLEKAQQYYSTSLLCNIVLGVALLAAFGVLVYNLENCISIESANVLDVKILFACVFLNFIINLFSSSLGVAFYVKNQIYLRNLIDMIRNIFNSLLLLFLLASESNPYCLFLDALYTSCCANDAQHRKKLHFSLLIDNPRPLLSHQSKGRGLYYFTSV